MRHGRFHSAEGEEKLKRRQPGWGEKRPECARFQKDQITSIKPLGEGSQGAVEVAFVPNFGICVVKLLAVRNGPFVAEQEKNAIRELIASQLLAHHPNIVNFYGTVYEKGQTKDSVIGFVSEFMSGGSLDRVMNEKAKESYSKWEKRACRWAVQIARALAYCHSQNVIHRDIKPDNTLLSDDLKTIKLCDFGLARPETDKDASKSRGTVLYIAPEVIKYRKYDTSVDVFSFGMFLYALFHRRHPFVEYLNEFYKDENLYYKHIAEDNLRPQLNKEVPELIKQIISRCWMTNPAERLKMSDVTKYLERFWNDKYPKEFF